MISRPVSFFALALVVFFSGFLRADEGDDGPLIAITSPDEATTFAYGSIKDRALIWDKREKMLIARVTFTDAEQSDGMSSDDTHEFRLPGVAFDEAKGVFWAVSPKGINVPVARTKKTLFFKTIEILPNAAVRIIRQRSHVTVILEAISPDDPAMHAAPNDSGGTHQVDPAKVFQ